jgi:hypothetical protein
MQLINVIRPLAGLFAGGLIGLGFGWVQNLALKQNQKRQECGSLHSGWAVMPGSMGRVAYLLVALLAVQILCPLLFTDGVQWWVSSGVLAGYGTMLYRQLWLRR